MRGASLHNYMAEKIAEVASSFFDGIFLEYRCQTRGITTFFDVFAERNSIALAFEVETTVRHAVENANKAALVDVPLWIIVPSRCLRTALAERLQPLRLRPGGVPIRILLLGSLEQELTNYLSNLSRRIANG